MSTTDALYRLVEAQESTGDLYQYSYDAAGNRLRKIEPGTAVTATYDAANQLLALNGQPVSHDANGNLLDDGSYSYTYNDFDQLIAVTDGISQTLYGYNGDGDRLWQQTDGVTTTFTLDLNGALAQVLAQSRQSVNGATTYFVPGSGAQQTQNVWRYLHSDGLGSVRHVTGAAGQVLGQMRYTPFGEITEQSGATALFGFTGEAQGGLSELVYLRARYYNPSLGRFQTQDSLIPDVTNGQALNAYAYVHNDPVNLVDPSGHVPALPVQGIDAIPSRDDIRGALRKPFEAGLDFLNWYLSEPEGCTCAGSNHAFWGPVAGVAAQGVNGVATTPAEMHGSKVVETLVSRQVERAVSLRWLKNSRVMRRFPILRALTPSKITLGHRTVYSWQASAPVYGTLDELVEPGMPRANGTHYTGTNRRVTLNTKPRTRPGPSGFAGAAAWAAWIDGITQLISDWDLCLSPMQKANRFALALVLGLAGGTFAGLAFTGATAFVAATGIGAGVTILGAPVVPILVGLYAGYRFAQSANHMKEIWYEKYPHYFK